MEAQNPNQPQPTNPGRARRKWLRCLAVPIAVAVLALVYQLTRPPELVWWRSPESSNAGVRVKVLIPNSWHMINRQGVKDSKTEGIDIYYFSPVTVPVQALNPNVHEEGFVMLLVGHGTDDSSPGDPSIRTEFCVTERTISRKETQHYAYIMYARKNRAAFKRTSQQICNSLKFD